MTTIPDISTNNFASNTTQPIDIPSPTWVLKRRINPFDEDMMWASLHGRIQIKENSPSEEQVINKVAAESLMFEDMFEEEKIDGPEDVFDCYEKKSDKLSLASLEFTSPPEYVFKEKIDGPEDANREKVLTAIHDCYEKKSSKLSLAGLELTSLPEEIGLLTHLKELDLSKNKLTSLPECIGNLRNLTNLKLHCNKLTDLPDSMRNLNQLKILNVLNNRIPKSTLLTSELKKQCKQFLI